MEVEEEEEGILVEVEEVVVDAEVEVEDEV